jgi:hypothetical protein
MSSWYDMMAAEEQRNNMRIVRMTPTEWKAETQHMLRTVRGDTRHVLSKIRAMEAERAASAAPPAPVALPQSNLDMRVWRDMVEEPEKYGEDIAEWLELDAKLRNSSGHWRVEAYWLEKEAELEKAEADAQIQWRAIYSVAARQASAAGMKAWVTRDIKRHVARFKKAVCSIQSAVRGHQMRTRANYLDCCMCLTHRICPLQTDVGMMCRECAEQGPYEDITGCDDPWDWFRSDYVDLAIPDPPVCLMCGDNADGGDVLAGTWQFCSRVCKTAWCREE